MWQHWWRPHSDQLLLREFVAEMKGTATGNSAVDPPRTHKRRNVMVKDLSHVFVKSCFIEFVPFVCLSYCWQCYSYFGRCCKTWSNCRFYLQAKVGRNTFSSSIWTRSLSWGNVGHIRNTTMYGLFYTKPWQCAYSSTITAQNYSSSASPPGTRAMLLLYRSPRFSMNEVN